MSKDPLLILLNLAGKWGLSVPKYVVQAPAEGHKMDLHYKTFKGYKFFTIK
jgi:hypothetical protein